jgi:hypothetical protein
MTVITATPPARPRAPQSAERRRYLPSQTEALAGQRLATAFLLRGCEGALFDLRSSLGRTDSPRDVRVGLAAAALLEDVLLSWRETLCLLDEAGAPPAARDDWPACAPATP